MKELANNSTNEDLIEFAKEQFVIFPGYSYMGIFLRKAVKVLEESPCEDAPDTNVGSKKQAEPCEDVVSREDVIKAIDRHTFDTDDGLCLDEDISIILEELPSVTPTKRWIPCSERLPEDFQRVLVTVERYNGDKVARVAEYIGRKRIFKIKENHEQWEVGEKGLLAWMPLPEPYKADNRTEQGLAYADQDTMMPAT